MSTIQELEQKVEQLERDILAEKQNTDLLKEKANKAIEYAKHAYKVDHYGIIWEWDTEAEGYRKTNMRIISPTVADRALESKHIADNAIEGRHLQDNVIEGRMIKNKTIDGRSLKGDIIGPELILDNSIPGDRYINGAFIPGKLADNAVATRNIQPKAVVASKLGDDVVPTVVIPVMRQITEDLQNAIDAFDEHGFFVSNQFGNDAHIGISQKTITEAINRIWQKIEDMTGEVLQGVNMVVTPTFFVSEDGCDIHIAANTVETNGLFEKIQFFVDGELIHKEEFAEYVSFDHHIDVKPAPDYTYVIMCKAKIMGVEYTRQQVITRYNEFFIGAGSAYTDILDSAHSRQLNGTMRHNYDVTFGEGDKLIIVMGATLRDGFIRADLNGVEIELTEQTVTIGDKQYVVLTSEPWSEGDYNIDING